MQKRGLPAWVSLMLLAVGLLVVAIPGFWLYVNATATKLHPSLATIPAATSTPPKPQWAGAVEKGRMIARTSLSERNLPGLSVAVGIDGDLVWAEGLGFANLEARVPVTPRDRFRIGTASSVFTSAGIGLLADQGRLNLDDKVQTYVPEFPSKQWPVTIRQVMGQVGGIMAEDIDNGVLTSGHCTQTAEAVQRFAQQPLVTQPGTAYQESTFGWVLLSAVAEATAKRPFPAFLEEQVFRPLGMIDSAKESGTEAESRRAGSEATSYYPRFAPNPIFALPRYGMKPLHLFDYSCYAGAGGYWSTPSDLVRFGMALNGGKFLRRETAQMLQTPQRLASGKETGFGLGWELKTVTLGGKAERASAVDGLLWGGTVATLLTFPERRLVVAVASNISFADTEKLAGRIAAVFAERDTAGR